MKNTQQLSNHVQLKSLMLQVQSDIKNNNGQEAIENIHKCLAYMIHQFICAMRRDLVNTTFEYRLNMLRQSGAIKPDYMVLHNKILDVKENGADIQSVRQVYTSLLDLADDFLETLEYPLVVQTNHPQLDQIVFDYRIHLYEHDYKKAALSMKQLVEYMISQYEREYAQDLRIELWQTKCVILAQRNLITERTANIWKSVYELGNEAVTWNQQEDVKVDEVKQNHDLLEETKKEFFARFKVPSEKEISRQNMYIHGKAYQPNGGKSKMVYTTHISKEEMDRNRERLEQADKELSKKRLESLSKLWLIGFGIAIVALILSIFLRTIGKIPILSFVIIYVVYKIIKKRKDDHTEEK